MLLSLLPTFVSHRAYAWGPVWHSAMDYTYAKTDKRNNVFYVGEPVTFSLPYAAGEFYQVRDYYGVIVDQGPISYQALSVNVTNPGWYKLYLYRTASTGGLQVAGSTMFTIFRNDPNFPPRPANPNEFGGNSSNDEILRGLVGLGPERFQMDGNTSQQELDVSKRYYLPYDPVRKRSLLGVFPYGLGTFDDAIEYWETRNEPNFFVSVSDYINKDLAPFYRAAHARNANFKVLGPGVVTIGPYGLGWIGDFLNQGGGQYIDALSFHAYNNVNGDLALARRSLKGLKDVIKTYSQQGKIPPNIELWQTEQGYNAAVFGAYMPRLQGRWTMLQMMTFEQVGIPKEHNHYWYAKSMGFWDSPTFIENDDGTINPAATLMRVYSEELFGTRFVSKVNFGPEDISTELDDLAPISDPNAKHYTLGNRLFVGNRFESPDGRKRILAIMSAGDNRSSIRARVTGNSQVKLVSPFGVTQTVQAAAGGDIVLPVTELPSYIELAPGQEVVVVPLDFGPNIALTPNAVADASGDLEHKGNRQIATNPRTKINDGALQNWYWNQNDWARPWMAANDLQWDSFPDNSWVSLTFPQPRTVGTVVIYANAPWQLEGTLIDYELQYKDPSDQWVTATHVKEPSTTIVGETASTKTAVDTFFGDRWIFRHHLPQPVTTSAIRLLVHEASYGGVANKTIADLGGMGGVHDISLKEIEVYSGGAGEPGEVVLASTLPPTTSVTITTPIQAPVVQFPAGFLIAGNSALAGAPPQKFLFYSDGLKVGEQPAEGSRYFSFQWDRLPIGQHNLQVVAIINDQLSVTSTSMMANVVEPASASRSIIPGYRGAPYLGTPPSTLPLPVIPGTIQFSRYDEGGEGIAYHDNTTGNIVSATYRTNENVDSQPNVLQYTSPKEWVNYSVNVQRASRYDIFVSNNYNGDGGKYHLEVDGVDITGSLTVINTQEWSTPDEAKVAATVQLPAGNHLVKLALDQQGSNGDYVGNFYSMRFEDVGGSNPDLALQATLASPVVSQQFIAPATIPISVTVSSPNGTVQNVEFFQNGSKFGERASAPYSFNWTGVQVGDYSIVARVTNSQGTVATTRPVNVHVQGPNSVPYIFLSVSPDQERYIAPAAMTLTAGVFDADGPITKVEYFLNGGKLGERLTAPYSFAFTGLPVGEYNLTAIATDGRGAVSAPSAFTIKVVPAARSDPPPVDSPASASFLRADVSTQGNWKNAFGSDGYAIAQDASPFPWYADVTFLNALQWVFDRDPTDRRAPQRGSAPNLDSRVAAIWYNHEQPTDGAGQQSNSVSIEVKIKDGKTHPVSLYFLDYESYAGPRSSRVDVVDANTGQTLNSQTLGSYNQGVYLSWNIGGKVRFVITTLAGGNSSFSGIFFGQGSSPVTVTPTVKAVSRGAGGMTVTIDSYSGHTYQLQRSSALERVAFANFAMPQPGSTGSTLTFVDPNPPDLASFYRFVVDP